MLPRPDLESSLSNARQKPIISAGRPWQVSERLVETRNQCSVGGSEKLLQPRRLGLAPRNKKVFALFEPIFWVVTSLPSFEVI
ncbi:hypothetical protein HMPREF0185_00054 [Brevundimonas diminuta 470-4]|nr:hypothetical protein HMPREF0185_00054 [Brevundimonas diminuta 470-4]